MGLLGEGLEAFGEAGESSSVEAACPGFAEAEFVGDVVEARAFEIVAADEFGFFVR